MRLTDDGGVTQAFVKQLSFAEHRRRFTIAVTAAGWEVSEEFDREVVRRVAYQDWHRVERARRLFDATLEQLRAEGWSDDAN